ncbi:prisilkin-39-like [Zootermopsis nevadensis]|uniref:Uncharacterized protein n=1 Tax=Zootermopsis nevadensis TaxID=136037 RepID=A0A067QXF2_ZOONE|nr:prisilkin-39-like [Zootermopsis nevadensis]KDR10816.1 hypothetical protein L798_14910 [Zootermopsis nevadensis]
MLMALLALVSAAPAEKELLEQSEPKETLKTANSYGYGYGYGLYGGYPYGYGSNGLYGWGYPYYGYGHGGYGHGLYGHYPNYWW